MGVKFYVVLRWLVGSFDTHQLIFYAGTTEEEAKDTAKVVEELASRVGVNLGDFDITVVTEDQLIHQINMATKTVIVQPFKVLHID